MFSRCIYEFEFHLEHVVYIVIKLNNGSCKNSIFINKNLYKVTAIIKYNFCA